jgi:hypothetical protein
LHKSLFIKKIPRSPNGLSFKSNSRSKETTIKVYPASKTDAKITIMKHQNQVRKVFEKVIIIRLVGFIKEKGHFV